MKPTLSRSILWAFFAGQASPLQKKLITEWLEDRANRDLFFTALHEWEKENPQFLPNTDQNWYQLMTRISVSPATEASGPSPLTRATAYDWLLRIATEASGPSPLPMAPPAGRSIRFFPKLAIAASLTLLLMAAAWFQWRYVTYRTTFGEVATQLLADSSRVTLNANSTLRVPRFDWGSGPREVWLTGEAEFSVRHTADNRRFLVKTPEGVEVEVLGTEFVVFSRERGTQVALSSGSVRLRSTARIEPLTIKPGDVVSVDKKGAFQLRSHQPVPAYSAWKEHRFVFNRTPLRDIALQVNETFGVAVQIPDETLSNRQLTGTYEAKNASELLQVVTRLLDLSMSQQGKTIILSSKN